MPLPSSFVELRQLLALDVVRTPRDSAPILIDFFAVLREPDSTNDRRLTGFQQLPAGNPCPVGHVLMVMLGDLSKLSRYERDLQKQLELAVQELREAAASRLELLVEENAD